MGFLDDLVEGFGKHLDIKLAVDASKDANGKVDIAKATGIVMGKGLTSDLDMLDLYETLNKEGAFSISGTGISGNGVSNIDTPQHTINDSAKSYLKLCGNDILLRDMQRLHGAGYSDSDLDSMDASELKQVMRDEGIDTDAYKFADSTFLCGELITSEDMELLLDAGYDEFTLDLMDESELIEAMEDAGVDPYYYGFDED